jgi:hypothetical protein
MKFLEQLLRAGCTHRFSWPRVDDKGNHYQICLACGTAYEYDWRMMRQTGRLLATIAGGGGHAPSPAACAPSNRG